MSIAYATKMIALNDSGVSDDRSDIRNKSNWAVNHSET